MRWLADLAGGGIGGTIKAVADVADMFIETPAEKRAAASGKYAAETERMQIMQAIQAKQIDVNIEQAKHPSLFVAGARPAALWLCVGCIAYHFILHDTIAWAIAVWAPDVKPPPDLDVSELMFLASGLLGLGGMRSWEKNKGVARNNLIKGQS